MKRYRVRIWTSDSGPLDSDFETDDRAAAVKHLWEKVNDLRGQHSWFRVELHLQCKPGTWAVQHYIHVGYALSGVAGVDW